MERNINRFTLGFSKGMTNIPSDLLCDDTNLVESDGFIYRDGEMKPIQKPKLLNGSVSNEKIVYVHKGADYENLITQGEGPSLFWYKLDGESITLSDDSSNKIADLSGEDIYDIKSVGNTLVVSTSVGLYYILYKGGKYLSLGTELPTPTFIPQLMEESNVSLGGTSVCELKEVIDSADRAAVYNEDGTLASIDNNSTIEEDRKYYEYSVINDISKKETFQNATLGHYMAIVSKIKETNRFAFPFFVRYALRLFDGTFARISAPIPVYPSISRNCKFTPVAYNKDTKSYEETKDKTYTFEASIRYARLGFKATIDNKDAWKDIVKELVVFASDDVTIIDTEKDFKFARATEVNGEYYLNFVDYNNKYKPQPSGDFDIKLPEYKFEFTLSGYKARDIIMPTYKTEQEIKDELLSKSQFYKLFSVKIDNTYYIQDTEWRKAPIDKHVVENLTSQEQLKVDDYYGWTKKIIKNLFPYNKRLNAFDIKRDFFEGFNDLTPYHTYSNNKFDFTYYTHIVKNNCDVWVKSKDVSVQYPQCAASWLFYPDPKATEMIVWENNSNKGMRVSLQEHPMLNGAYAFNALPLDDTFVADDDIEKPTVNVDDYEYLDSQIYTSVVNNPFVFEASGDNTIGTGRILNISANTEAISQGQFGQYPLLVFTSEGIYGMSVNSEGLYSASYPISREVCSDDSVIVPTDRLVFFVSKKGLMATSGGAVANMSELMRGRIARNFSTLNEDGFLNFIDGCIIAYDYRDSLLRIYKPGKEHHFIYNMIDKTFGMINDGMDVCNIVSNYPDTLIQDKDGNVYTLTGKSDINDDENLYNGTFTSRPLKLGGSTHLKSIRDIKLLYDSDEGNVSLELWGSNDCKHWQKLSSLHGKPWKYFTIRYKLNKFKATDSFSGSIVEVQTRRDDKMR